MDLSYYFPELNDGQLKMLERMMDEREKNAISKFMQGAEESSRQ